MSAFQIDRAISKVEAFSQPGNTIYKERSDLLHNVATRMRCQKQYLARLITMDMDKSDYQARIEINLSADILDYYADKSTKLLVYKSLETEQRSAFIHYSPVSILSGAATGHFSFYQIAWFAAPNIMGGNTVLVKHACFIPKCAMVMEDLFSQAGASKSIFTNLLIPEKFASVQDVSIGPGTLPC